MRKHEEGEFDAVFWKYKDMVYHTALNYFKNTQDAEEIVQETFMKVYMHYSKFKGKASLKTWIYRIGLNEVYTRFRKRKKHIQNREWEFEESIKGFSKVDWELEAGDLKRDFCEFIRFLPKKRSKVMFLRVLEKMSFKEIGETLGISEASAKNLFSMGLKDIRKKMEEGNHGSGNAKMAIHADRH